MELDTLYFYKLNSKNDKKNQEKGEIKMKDCLEIIEKSMKKSKEKGYSFKINVGDILIHVNVESEAERRKLIQIVLNRVFIFYLKVDRGFEKFNGYSKGKKERN